MFAALRSARQQRDIAPLAAPLHWMSLAGAFVYLLWENRHQWFYIDDWAMIVDRGILGHHFQGLWEPHNEHWSTIPILIYRALFGIFGVRTYLPYVVVLVLVHLLTVHLLWRVMLRCGVTAIVATSTCAIFAVLGSGWENLTWAFQLSVIGSIAMGLAALLVAPETGPFTRRDVWVWVLAIISLMFSGVGITMVVIIGVTTFLRRGVKVAALTIAVPAAAYLVWYAAYGHNAAPAPKQQSFTTALQAAPAFVWRGLTDAVDSTSGFAGIGPVVLVLLGLWLVLSLRPDRSPWPTVAAMTLGAVVFLALVDIRRSGLGIEVAGSSRYVYVVVALLLLTATLAAMSQLERSNIRYVILFGFTAVLLFIQVSTLNREANRLAEIKQDAKHVIVAAARLLTHHEPIVSDTPSPKFAPNLQADELERLARDHKLPGNVAVTTPDINTARAYLQVQLGTIPLVQAGPVPPALVGVSGVSAASTPAACLQLTPLGDDPRARFRFASRGTLQLTSSRSGTYQVRVGTAQDREFGGSNPLDAPGARARVLSVSASDVTVELEIPGAGATTVCGLQPVNQALL